MGTKSSVRKAAIIHPDFGIGGAEQLMLNLGLALNDIGYEVTIYTPEFDPNHCFSQLKEGKFKISVHGKWIPRNICNKFNALCAYIRMWICALVIVFCGPRYDIIVLDQVPLPIPFLKILKAKIFFYCHYPDKLLCVERRSCFKKLYRFIIDTIEEFCIYFADSVMVNSKFTRSVFMNNFKCIAKRRCCCKGIEPNVLYPALDFSMFQNKNRDEEILKSMGLNDKFLITSLNRYERKKNIQLALDSFAVLSKKQEKIQKDKLFLVIAGGYDLKVRENVEYKQELEKSAKELGIIENVKFLTSISDEQRSSLLRNSSILLYTPEKEHFGIVPLEAMYNRCVVIACKSGGPCETVIENVTGFLLEPNPEQWGNKMCQIIDNNLIKKIGDEGHKHVEENFSNDVFRRDLETIINTKIKKKK